MTGNTDADLAHVKPLADVRSIPHSANLPKRGTKPPEVSYNEAMARTPGRPLDALLDDFLTYLEITKGRTRGTTENYRFYLTRFFDVAGVARPSDITKEIVQRFRLRLNRMSDAAGKPLAKVTQNYHLIALRSFLKFLAKEDHRTLAPEKVELAKLPERQVDFLDADDVATLLAAPMGLDQAKRIQLRDAAILETLFSTGLRVSELVSLKREIYNPKKEEVSVRGKGGKVRVVFLSERARAAIDAYLVARTDNAPHVFLRHDRAAGAAVTDEGVPLTPRSVERLVTRYAKLAGITKHVSPHTLRHSYATDLLMNGADLRSVQELLGHSSITTTQLYTHVTNQQLKDVHKAFHGRRRKE